ncbi:MAG: purine nucleoside phosphorylase I, inosine and guanosine-specific [Bacteroidales bacterium]|nr:purine nucleoside phosphorylase I, inosine and guanosine-specific [Bacteroidales bacterium]
MQNNPNTVPEKTDHFWNDSAAFIAERINGEIPETAVILGSGLGLMAEKTERPVVIPYAEIPHFAQSTATGHKGNLICGMLGGKRVLLMQGRFHYYEGYAMHEVAYPVRVFRCLGVKTLFVSNAAGSVNSAYKAGDMMIIRDHINLLPNPLVGKNIDGMGPRFPDMTHAYDRSLIRLAEKIASEHGIRLHKGVYLANSGPSFETPAEYNFFRIIGADAVGMSTTPEVIAARHCGLRVFGMSVITNEAHEFSDGYMNDGNEVIEAANKAVAVMSFLFAEMIRRLDEA